jgi:glycosyltransferase involved in cell wall biosynthesis
LKSILFVTYEYPTFTPFGGIAFYYAKVAELLSKQGFFVTVIAAKVDEHGFGEIEKNLNQTLSHVYITCKNLADFEKYAAKWITEQKKNFDFIEIPEQSALLLEPMLKGIHREVNAKLIVRVHGTTILSRLFNVESEFTGFATFCYNKFLLNAKIVRLSKRLSPKVYGIAKRNFREYILVKNADIVTAPSRIMAVFINKYWVKQNRTIVFPNPSQYLFEDYDKKPFDKTEFKVSYVNRLQYLKGFDLFYLLSKQFSEKQNIHFSAFGSHSQLNIGYTKDEISETVELEGFVNANELIEVYRKSHIVIVPSRFESFSNVALEAMGFGCLIIVSDNMGISEHIVHGTNGFVFKSGKYHSLEAVFTEIIGMDSSELERISFNAYETALKLSENKELLEFYHSI